MFRAYSRLSIQESPLAGLEVLYGVLGIDPHQNHCIYGSRNCLLSLQGTEWKENESKKTTC